MRCCVEANAQKSHNRMRVNDKTIFSVFLHFTVPFVCHRVGWCKRCKEFTYTSNGFIIHTHTYARTFEPQQTVIQHTIGVVYNENFHWMHVDSCYVERFVYHIILLCFSSLLEVLINYSNSIPN